jgi:hypothetical protein
MGWRLKDLIPIKVNFALKKCRMMRGLEVWKNSSSQADLSFRRSKRMFFYVKYHQGTDESHSDGNNPL